MSYHVATVEPGDVSISMSDDTTPPMQHEQSPGGGASATATAIKPKASLQKRVDRMPPWNVVLLNDDDHTYEYVITMVQEVFAHGLEKSFQIAKTVDKDGRAILLTTHKEHAELKRDQILGYGADRLVAGCRGSMSAIIEPAEFGDDGGSDGEHGPGEDA